MYYNNTHLATVCWKRWGEMFELFTGPKCWVELTPPRPGQFGRKRGRLNSTQHFRIQKSWLWVQISNHRVLARRNTIEPVDSQQPHWFKNIFPIIFTSFFTVNCYVKYLILFKERDQFELLSNSRLYLLGFFHGFSLLENHKILNS